VRAIHPVVIDGRDDDEVWRLAPPITQFREFQPKEDGDPRFPTAAKVAYDDRYLYVFIRAFDPIRQHSQAAGAPRRPRRHRSAEDHGRLLPRPPLGLRVAVNPAG